MKDFWLLITEEVNKKIKALEIGINYEDYDYSKFEDFEVDEYTIDDYINHQFSIRTNNDYEEELNNEELLEIKAMDIYIKCLERKHIKLAKNIKSKYEVNFVWD